jgi:hypothetical protein
MKMQGILADLRLGERAELGRAFLGVITKVRSGAKGFAYQSLWLDSRPEWVFVFASSKNIARSEVLTRLRALMSGAMAFYQRNCMIVADRDSVGYEVSLGFLGSPSTPTEQKIGQELFGRLRTMTTPIRVGP